jgi:hypothetical protein
MVKPQSTILLFVVLIGCATAPTQSRLTTAEVIRLADAEARRHGYDLQVYKRPVVRYNPVYERNTWIVSYDEKPVNGMVHIGFDFNVHIEDRTKKLWLIPGR